MNLLKLGPVMTDEIPELIVFAGANGSGKTTFALEFLKTQQAISKAFLNADEIAKGLSPLEPEAQRLQAGKILLNRMDDYISARKSFALETTLSGKTYVRRIQQAKKNGFKVFMYYLFTESPWLNVDRISGRVEEGGHHIEESDVVRRHKRSLEQLATNYWSICDLIFMFNMSKRHNKLVFIKDSEGKLKKATEDLYKADKDILDKLKRLKNEIVP
jgi:predicted ABC-type ATPase